MARLCTYLFLCGLLGCASTIPETKYLPEHSENVSSFFTNGQPIAAVRTDEAFLLLALEPSRLGETYIRVWMLYRNTSKKPILLEPLKLLTLETQRKSADRIESRPPESPTRILAKISNEKAANMIIQAIGGTLQAMSVQPTQSTSHGISTSSSGTTSSSTTTSYNDRTDKQRAILQQTEAAMANTAIWYDMFRESLNKGILRRNTVFPGQSVNGYVYFPISDRRRRRGETFFRHARSMEYTHTLTIGLSPEKQVVVFTPIEGE